MTRLSPDAAEALALKALAWLAADPDGLARFLAETGLDGAGLRAAAALPETLAGVLDHLLADEARLVAFCSETGIDPALPARARRLLPGAGNDW